MFFLALFLFISCKKEMAENIVIWTYDSFISEWGPGPEISRKFEEKTGVKIVWESGNDSGHIVSRLLLEGGNSSADIILGVDQNLAPRLLDSQLLEAYKPNGAEDIPQELVLDKAFRLTALDYSYFAFVYDSENINLPPASLEELCSPRFAGSIILIDPRTSSPGLGFFVWVREVYADAWQDYWQRLKPSILTVTESWSTAYGLFTRGEAPIVLSYTTSPGYHLEYEQTERYKTAIFREGHCMQVEAAGLLSSSKNKENAKAFLDFMLSPEFQNLIPLGNWMYPVLDIPLPPSFRVNPKSEKALQSSPVSEEELNEWAALMLYGDYSH